jgi:predicted CXXCH cytochrome family protein
MLMLAALVAPPSRSAESHPPAAIEDGAACVRCHAEITAKRVVHGPAAAGQCAACHVVAESKGTRRIALKGGVTARDTVKLCVTCHEDTAERLKQSHKHAPVASGNCTACHDPHGSAFRFQLAAEGNRTCVSCHEDIAQVMSQSHVHGPAAASCAICHDAHAAPNAAQLKAAGNAMCMTCHLNAPADAAIADPRAVFGRTPIPGIEKLISTAPRISLDASLTSGHPTIRHPVDNRRDPSEPSRTLRCASCHNPHGSSGSKLLRFGAAGVSPLCVRCHSF